MKDNIDAANILQQLIDSKQDDIDRLYSEIHSLRQTKQMVLNKGFEDKREDII